MSTTEVSTVTKTDVTQSPSDRTPLLVVRDLTVRFPTERGTVHAVDEVSFDLAEGETLGIVGESGSGKSVLVRSVMQLTPPHAAMAGSVQFGGRDLRKLSKAQARRLWGAEIGMVFQDSMTSLNPVTRIGRQLTETLRLHLELSREDARARALSLLREVGIPNPERRLNEYPHQLSGGMRQRVSIALAIACGPKLVLADEPTTALDVTIQRQILDLLGQLQRDNGMAMVLVTHDLGVVASRTDNIIVMYAGRAVESGPTAALFDSPRHPYTNALMSSIPRLEQQSRTKLTVIPGRPVDVLNPRSACRFAPRCTLAQPRCLDEEPSLSPPNAVGQRFACFYPVGTPAGDEAARSNAAAGRTAAGLILDSAEVG